MLVQTIINYLKSHKRLIVPQLGAFIVKEVDQNILFSELLRRDDGVLRGLLCEAGVGEVEAAGAIDRFVFEVRHAIQGGGEYVMSGFGTLRAGENATIVFIYDPRVVSAVATEVPLHHREPVAEVGEEPKLTVSPKMKPEPYVKGLCYGRPEKSTNAYTYVDHAPRRGGFDKLLIVAIVAAVIALAAIAYGYLSPSSEVDVEGVPTEQISADSTAMTGLPINEDQTTTSQE
ncbi:MAG: hypothetical protein RSB29_02630 [Alistipes sp.]